MSYKIREKKRKAKAAQAAAAANRNAETARRYFLTPVKSTCACARCSKVMRPSSDMVFRHTPRETLCVLCADRDPALRYRPSLRWERHRRKGRR